MEIFPHVFFGAMSAAVFAAPVLCANDADGARNPFRSEAVVENSTTMAASSPLSAFELRGILRSERETRVCFVDTRSRKASWLIVGTAEENGMIAEQYDSDRGAVLVRSGETSRWFELRKNKVRAIPIATLADGTVDIFHMSLTEKEKAEEARAMLGDILEVSRLGRAGLLKKGKAADPDSNISQQR